MSSFISVSESEATDLTNPDVLHRLVKQVMDNGTASTVAEAEAIFKGYKIEIDFQPQGDDELGQQAMLLTCVALAKRVFLGGVTVYGVLSGTQNTPLPLGPTLADAIKSLGGSVSDEKPTGRVRILIGNAIAPTDGFSVRPLASGWRAGIVPGRGPSVLNGKRSLPTSAMFAAALAINEAFLYVNGAAPVAGQRSLGLSLWRLKTDADWTLEDDSEPELTYLPASLWVIGLGHLGQAYLWALGLLPYGYDQALKLVLQDTDAVTSSTESTSILTDTSMVGLKKTRVMMSWGERRGFDVVLHERLFGPWIKRQPFEPPVALCGIDNALGRRALDQAGFDLILEAGLGQGHRDFRTMRIHTFPGSRSSGEIWKRNRTRDEDIVQNPAYENLLSQGRLDQCGVTLLAGKAVGAPFVGAVAAALVLSELLRVLHGGCLNQLIDFDLLSVDERSVVPSKQNLSDFNPGFVMANEIESQPMS
jgi:hypothetical protein